MKYAERHGRPPPKTAAALLPGSALRPRCRTALCRFAAGSADNALQRTTPVLPGASRCNISMSDASVTPIESSVHDKVEE